MNLQKNETSNVENGFSEENIPLGTQCKNNACKTVSNTIIPKE